MASELGLPPPAKRPPATPTTIASISDDLLCEIFLLLPSLPSLVRAALACRTFLNAVRSSPAFRRRFWALHPPQLLGFFIEPCRAAVPPFVPLRSRSDPDLAAAVRGSDFFLTRLPEDSGDSTLGWKLQGLHGGYVVLADDATDQIAAYNPVTQALHLLPRPPKEILFSNSLEFHIVFSEEDQRVFRMVCVQHQDGQVPACVAVFSTATREWQFLPWVETPPPPPHDFIKFCPGTQLNGFVYWKHISRPYVLVLNTVTVQFSRVDLPPFLGHICPTRFRLGQTKDGMLCMVGIDDSDADTGMLHVWFRRADDDGVEKWVLGDTYILNTFVDATKADGDPTVHIEAVIDGFVYLSTKYDEHTNNHTESLLSLCLETAKLNKLFDDTYVSPAHPYIMAWPPSLVCSKEDSQTMVTGESVADAAPVGTKETSSVHASASQSYKFDK